jgi:hypothetical protein
MQSVEKKEFQVSRMMHLVLLHQAASACIEQPSIAASLVAS